VTNIPDTLDQLPVSEASSRNNILMGSYTDELRFLSKSDPYDNNIFRTEAGYIIPTVTGSISCLSSALIITIIARSVKNRSTSTYHRAMVWISLSDILSSTAIALTTIPMPADVSEVYDFGGESFGTTRTCELQGLCYSLGTGLSFCGNSFLAVFYLLTIRYQISDRVMTKIVEPIFWFVSIAASFYPAISLYMNDMFNPVPYISWCSSGDYPYGCNQEESVACIRGDKKNQSSFIFVLQIMIGLLLLQVIPLVMVVASVYKREHEICIGESEQDLQAREVRYADTRTIAKQAAMYAVAFSITYIFVPNITARTDSIVLQVLTIALNPLQGLFNAMIFVYLKVYVLREADHSLFFSEALYLVIVHPEKVPTVLLEMPAELTDKGCYPTAMQKRGTRNDQYDPTAMQKRSTRNVQEDVTINGNEATDNCSRGNEKEGQSGNEVDSFGLSYGRASSNVNSAALQDSFSEDSLPISLGLSYERASSNVNSVALQDSFSEDSVPISLG